VAISDFSTFSQMTGMRSEYFCRCRRQELVIWDRGGDDDGGDNGWSAIGLDC
jgi:hypothetical protein